MSKRINSLAFLIGICLFLACTEEGKSNSLVDAGGQQPDDSNPVIVNAGSGGEGTTMMQVDDSALEPMGNDAGIGDAETATPPIQGAGEGYAPIDSSVNGDQDAGLTESGTDSSETTPIQTCPATLPTPGNINRTINVDGVDRTYILYIPSSYTGQTPVPLLFDWHGLGMLAEWEQGVSTYIAKADAEGFVIVFPQGINNVWNVGPCCTQSRDVDDLGFARQMVNELTNELCIDSKRIYSVGWSMGSGMSLFLACNAADIFAAVAPAAFDLLVEDEEPCHPSRPITVISFRGTNDPIVPYIGGPSTPPTFLLGYTMPEIHFLGAEGTFQRFAELDECIGDPVAGIAAPECQTYTQCKDGVEVTLCAKQNGGHDPGDANIGWPLLKKYSLP